MEALRETKEQRQAAEQARKQRELEEADAKVETEGAETEGAERERERWNGHLFQGIISFSRTLLDALLHVLLVGLPLPP